MALTKIGTYTSPYTSPTFKYDLYYEITARGSGTATLRVVVDAYMTSSASYLGFNLDGRVDPAYASSQTKAIVTTSTPLSGTTKRRVSYTFSLTGVPSGGNSSASLGFDGLRPSNDGNSGKIDVNADFAIPAFALAPTAPTGVTSARVGDTQHTIAWTRTATTERPYTSQRVERWDNHANAWYTVATISGSATSYADNTTQANRRYQWRIRATNSAGSATSAASALRDTTPAAPSGLVAVKDTTDVVLTWSNPAENASGIEVWESQNGGAYALLHTASGTATAWTHVAPSTAVTHRYRVRAKATEGGTLYSVYSTESALITLLAAPFAPTNLSLPLGQDGTSTIRLAWTHVPADGTGQTAYSLRYRPVGGSWTTISKTTSGNRYRDLAAGTFTNGVTYEWQVQTWGQHPDASPWSSTAAFKASARPTVSIVTPAADEAHPYSYLTVEWVYADAENTPQSRFWLALLDELGNQLYTTTVQTAASSFAVPFALEDETTYVVQLRVWDSDGADSTIASRVFEVAYIQPIPAQLETEFDTLTGSLALMVTNPTPDTEPDVVYNRILRATPAGWELIDEVPPNGAITDFTPAVGVPVTYRVEAVSDVPSTAVTEVEVILDSQGRIYLNAGADVASVQLSVEVSESWRRSTSVEHFEGRTKPVLYQGVNETLEVQVKGTLADLAYRDTLKRVLNATGPILYRDPYGRRFYAAVADGYNISHRRGRIYDVSATFVEVEP